MQLDAVVLTEGDEIFGRGPHEQHIAGRESPLIERPAQAAAVAHEADHREVIALVFLDLGHRLVEERRIGQHRQLGEVIIEPELLGRRRGRLPLGEEQATDGHHIERAERRDGEADRRDGEDAETRATGLLEHGAGHEERGRADDRDRRPERRGEGERQQQLRWSDVVPAASSVVGSIMAVIVT